MVVTCFVHILPLHLLASNDWFAWDVTTLVLNCGYFGYTSLDFIWSSQCLQSDHFLSTTIPHFLIVKVHLLLQWISISFQRSLFLKSELYPSSGQKIHPCIAFTLKLNFLEIRRKKQKNTSTYTIGLTK